MTQDVNHTFELEAFIIKDPFYQIYLKKRDEESDFFYIHTDYFQYLQYLNIIWNRIREEYRTIGIYYRQEMDLDRRENLSREEIVRFRSLTRNQDNVLTILSCDIEAFILFARRFMDKVGRLVESLVKLDSGIKIGKSFSKHREFFINNTKYNPDYSSLLIKKTNWYEQDLLIWRDSIFVHGKTLNTAPLVSLRKGIELRKVIGVHRFREKDKTKFLIIKKKYEQRYPDLKITENPYVMIEEFREEIAKRNIKLDKKDLEDLRNIISMTGTSLNIAQLEKSIKDYVAKTALLFNSV